MVLTPEEIRDITGDDELFLRAHVAEIAMLEHGIDPVRHATNWGIIIPANRNSADEHGLNSRTLEPISGARNIVQAVVEQFMMIASRMDPDAVAHGLFYGETVTRGELIQLADIRGWVSRNRPKPAGRSHLGEALEAMIEIIAEEQKLPQLSAALKLGKDATPPRIPMVPYAIGVVAVGDPYNPYHLQDVLRRISGASIRVVIAYVSNQNIGLDVYKDITEGMENVHIVDFPRGLESVTEPVAVTRLIAGHAKWHDSQREAGLVPAV